MKFAPRPAPLAAPVVFKRRPRWADQSALPGPIMGKVVWDSIDDEAAAEGAAIGQSNRLRPRRPKGKHQA